MMRILAITVLALLLPSLAGAQAAAKHIYETLFTKPVRISLEPIAPTAGVTAGIGFKPKVWRTPKMIKSLQARASASQHKYWAADGSYAWQNFIGREWRVEPYARFRSMKRLNYFGIGDAEPTDEDEPANFAMLDRRVGAYAYIRPHGLFAIGGRSEGLWPRTSPGQNPDLQSVDQVFPPAALPGFMENTNYLYMGAFANLNYPYVRSEQPRRGGDYGASFGVFHDTSGTGNSFKRFELEGRERFPIAGPDRQLTLHGRLSSSFASSGQQVPFYLMDTLGGADNLRGFKESIIGGDEATSTLRSFESFRFRDRATAFVQIDFRQRVWSQIFITFFADAGAVAADFGGLGAANWHEGVGMGLSIYRTNALAIRAEVSLWGGPGHAHYFVPGRGINF
jgi:hypothetical protein